jgi:hypothetical protein
MGQSMKLVSAVVVVLMLTGCASSQQLTQTADEKCQTDGLKPGTSDYDKCRTAFDTARQQENTTRAMREQQDRMMRDAQTISRMGR